MAPATTGTSAPLIPPAPAAKDDTQPTVAPEVAAPVKSKRFLKLGIIGAAALVVLGAGGFFAWKTFMAPAPPPAPAPVQKKAAPPPAAPATPSATLNNLAHAPAKAVNKAKEALATREASGQAALDPALTGDDIANKSATPPPDAAKAAPEMRSSTAVTNLGPGLSATMEVSAMAEASAEFRTFVATMKISSVSWTTPARAFINGRLFRTGELVDPGLGIIFDGVDADTRQLIFKDRAGAAVARRY